MKKVMLIGDSIRLGYQKVVEEELLNEFEVWGSEDNCRFAKYTLKELGRMLKAFSEHENLKYKQDVLLQGEASTTDVIFPDIIHWNNGLWDTSIVCKEDGAFTPVDEYISYMSKILRELRKLTDKIIFATTTPVKPQKFDQDNGIIAEYNRRITEFMRAEGVIINDLNKIVSEDLDKYLADDNIHLSDEGKILCGKAVAEHIRKMVFDKLDDFVKEAQVTKKQYVWINVNKVDRKKRKNYTLINIASFSLGVRPLL